MCLNTQTMKFFFLYFTLLIGFCACNGKKEVSSPFVKQLNGHFEVNGKPYYFIGTNYWFGAILGSSGQGGNRGRLLKELDFMKANGINNLRVLVGADGPDGIATKVMPTLQKQPGVYNDTIFDGLDYLLSELAKREMYAVLYLNNSWEWSGGYGQYLNWVGYGEIPIPAEKGWSAFMDYVKQYATCDECKVMFLNHVKHVITRTNKYTGKKYTEDPAIFSWQVGNEPRAFSNEAKPAFAAWVKETTALMRSLDSNHLISLGTEGKSGLEGDLTLYEQIHSDPNVDYLTMHIWPKNWGWLDLTNISGSVDISIQKTDEYMKEHIAIAEKLNKPIVLEEFGFPRDNHKYTMDDPVTARDKYYSHVFAQIVDAKTNLGVFSGCNTWAWGGAGRPQHEFWQAWDDYVGDPAQEEQGLNSVFDVDSTVEIFKKYTGKLN